MTRYFAKKTNESSSPFEVSADDFETSPLYDYVSLLWYIRGNKRRLFKYNRREILIASRVIPNIGKLLPDYQYYRSAKKLTTKEEIQNRLGISSEHPKNKVISIKIYFFIGQIQVFYHLEFHLLLHWNIQLFHLK